MFDVKRRTFGWICRILVFLSFTIATLLLGNAVISSSQAFIYAMCLSGLIVLSLVWEMCLFGTFLRYEDFPTQLLLWLAFSCFLYHAIGSVVPDELPRYIPSMWGSWGDRANYLWRYMRFSLPDDVVTFLMNWRLIVIMVVFAVCMSVKARPFRLFSLICIILGVFIWALKLGRGNIQFVFGSLSLFSGIAGLICFKVGTPVFFAGIRFLERLKLENENEIREGVELLWLLRDGKIHTQEEVYEHYPKITSDILSEWAALGLCELRESIVGKQIQCTFQFRRTSISARIAQIPRVLLLSTIAICWFLFPVDLIPDMLPGIGLVDDLTVTLVAIKAWSNLKVN